MQFVKITENVQYVRKRSIESLFVLNILLTLLQLDLDMKLLYVRQWNGAGKFRTLHDLYKSSISAIAMRARFKLLQENSIARS